MAATNVHAKLDELWGFISTLKADSPQEEWDRFALYLSPDIIMYQKGINEPASHGREEVVAGFKNLLSFWAMVERRVLSQGVDAAGTTAFANMNNRLAIFGEEIDFAEMEVVKFDEEGRVLEHRLYCDPAPIMAIIQKKTAEKASA
ncbi:hypothetical protein EDB81DRAFT_787495 [Dactylonectria macrodidyma]|uniref:SnoaL-like domain-containing protein n=1 Tax=Dactylonectria macrodidyma TaxID=307937 RepID=A0A9P9FA01_9HYPO|nr:hypothetical protein EDB81DRAFT_787495 [Dactylonectria macrodidyma]